MTDLRKMGGKEHAPLLDKDSFLSPVTQAACAISQLSNDAFRKGEIVSIAEAEEIIKGYGLAPSEGMKPGLPTAEQLAQRMAYQHPDMEPGERQCQWEKIPGDNPWRKQWLDTAKLVIEFKQADIYLNKLRPGPRNQGTISRREPKNE